MGGNPCRESPDVLLLRRAALVGNFKTTVGVEAYRKA